MDHSSLNEIWSRQGQGGQVPLLFSRKKETLNNFRAELKRIEEFRYRFEMAKSKEEIENIEKEWLEHHKSMNAQGYLPVFDREK